ncbi:MAG TPA: M28 family peptidase [Gemmatimonadaceae bacterium]|nr:M28 family peptidase [Gemmatimonadaceae bacterium]
MPNAILHRAALVAAIVLAPACRSAVPVPPGESAARAISPRTGADTAVLRRDITHLASDSLEGRLTGTPGNDSAAAYIARRYAALRLEAPRGIADTSCIPVGQLRRSIEARTGTPIALSAKQPFACSSLYLQGFEATSVAAAHAGLPAALPAQNVVAIVPGTDPALRDEYVVIGAHYDHLGRSAFGALDPDAGDAIRPGADDNASGTAAVMELARLFTRHPARRSMLFVNFSGEELGLLGSEYFVEHPPVPLDRVVAMLNFDMVGRMRDDRLIVYGVSSATELRAIVDSANTVAPRLNIAALGDGFGPSDQSSFYAKGIPVLHFFTDIHEDYHRATDVASKIDVADEARVVNLAEGIARDLGDRAAHLTFVRTAPPPSLTGGVGTGVWFGSVPDMGAADVVGVRLAGVTPGSPADKAGVKKGDIVVEFGGVPVKDLYQYTDALRAHKPGDVVRVVVERAGSRLTFTATLGRRGS